MANKDPNSWSSNLNTVYDKDKPAPEVFEPGRENIAAKKERIKAYRKEASRMASLANKRVERLERNGLESSPAYQTYLKGGGRFGVKGKTWNELQQEVSRLNQFINSVTSTVKGVNDTLKEMAKNTGITYKSTADLRAKAPKFFELSSKVEQYLRNVEDIASAIGYQKIWEAVNQYVKDAQIDLSSGEADIDSMVKSVSDALVDFEQPAQIIAGWYSVKKDDLGSV